MGVLDGKIAVVTGAGRGIGREIALQFAAEGAKVVVNDLGGAADGSGTGRVADEVVAEIEAAGGTAAANYDTVATPEGGRAIFQTALDRFGGMDILVNNAGILRDRTLFKMEESDWDAVMDVHLKGHYCCTRPFAVYLRETNRSGGRIINFSSVSGLFGNFGQSNYGAAKAGIAGFSRVLALELAKYGCTVNTISPGAATRMTIDLMKGAGREVDPEDPLQGPQQIAPVVTWLASPAAQEVTGQIIHVMQGTVGIMQQPAIIRSFQNEHLWTLDELDQVIPSLVSAKQAHDERAAKEGTPEPISQLKALVVGGTGPTGPYLVQGLLARGYAVTILHRGEHEVPEIPPEVEHLHTDPWSGAALEACLSERRFDGFDLAVASYGRLREIARVLRGKAERFLGIGGVPLYRGWMRPEDWQPEGLPVPTAEDAPKIESQDELRKGFQILRSEEAVFEHHPHATMFRYPHVYGPRQLVPREWCIVRRILDGRRQLVLGDGGLTLHTFGYAENLAHALLLAVDQPDAAAGESFNCGDEQVWSLRQVATTVARIMGQPLEIVSVPGAFAFSTQPMLAHERTDHRVMDLAKIKRELGYRDPVPTEEGLRRTVAWLLEHRPEPGGLTEQILGDTFDYAAEDQIVAAQREYEAKLGAVAYVDRPGPGLSYVPPERRGVPRDG